MNYFNTVGTFSPVPCPLGTVSNITGLRSEDECQPCPGGFYCANTALSVPSGLCSEGCVQNQMNQLNHASSLMLNLINFYQGNQIYLDVFLKDFTALSMQQPPSQLMGPQETSAHMVITV